MSAAIRNTYDHRLRNLVAVAGAEVVNDIALPRSTVATWKKRGHLAVVSSNVLEQTDLELSAKLVRLERRLAVMRSLLCLLLVLIRVRGARLTDDRLSEGRDKERILVAIDRAVKVVPRWLALAAVGMNEARLRRWKQRAALCTLDDRSPCPKQQPSRLTFAEEQTMRGLVESHELRHMSVSALVVHAKRVGALFASKATWFRAIRDKGWIRPKQRVHPEGPRVGIRASAVGELLHVDVTIIRLLDGTKVFLQAVLDNFSRRILSWRVSPALETWRTAELLKAAVSELRQVGACGTKLVADSDVENINDVVDAALKETGVERILAQVEVSWSNSLIEVFWRQLKNSWLYLNHLDSFAAVERLVGFYVDQHNRVIPHSALMGRTPDEVFRGEASDLPERLREAHRVAIQERVASNRRLNCESCQVTTRANAGSSEIAEGVRKVE